MSSLPREVLEDVLQPLDRWTLDAVQFISRRFLQLIMECMSEVCLRQIESGEFRAPSGNTSGSWHIDVDGPPGWEIRKDTTRPFSEFAQALQSSRVGYLMFRELVFTAELATLVLQTPIIAKVLNFHGGSCAQLTPTQLRKVLVHFSPTALYLESCGLRVCHLSDELFRAMFKKCLRYTFLRELEPIDGDVFCVTNDLVVDFCMQQDVQVIEAPSDSPPASPSRRIPHAELNLKDGTFTKDLFKRLVEASRVSTRTQSLRIAASPVPIADEDLREFAQHLSSRKSCRLGRGFRWPSRIYDFPGEQHGAVAAIHTQIVLYSDPDNTLELIRAQRPFRYFH